MSETLAVVLRGPEQLSLQRLALVDPGPDDVVVDVDWSGISTGTERMLYRGTMPPFPGMGYPLVPGYESVGRVVEAGETASLAAGDRVFVPGANCFGEVRSLFGGAASRLVVPEARLTRIDENLGSKAVLLALAATAHHALAAGDLPELIVGHGVLGRLLARITVALGGAPLVWEKSDARLDGADGYQVVDPEDDDRRDYATICDASGDPDLIDTLVARLAKRGEIALAGFYANKLSFTFPLAFMKEARFRIAAEFQSEDLQAVLGLLRKGSLGLEGLVSHEASFGEAEQAYATAFDDPACLKMLIDWRSSS